MSRGNDSPGASTSTTIDVTTKIEQMQQENADVFAIPDYFVYMSRAFSTLEGIGLSSNTNYSILQECYPYLAKRLLSDDSPRARNALRTLLYGTSNNNSSHNDNNNRRDYKVIPHPHRVWTVGVGLVLGLVVAALALVLLALMITITMSILKVVMLPLNRSPMLSLVRIPIMYKKYY